MRINYWLRHYTSHSETPTSAKALRSMPTIVNAAFVQAESTPGGTYTRRIPSSVTILRKTRKVYAKP